MKLTLSRPEPVGEPTDSLSLTEQLGSNKDPGNNHPICPLAYTGAMKMIFSTHVRLILSTIQTTSGQHASLLTR